jgi:hypothetical protein
MRKLIGAGIATAAFLVCGGTAAAATFYVDDNSAGTPPSCTSPAPPVCKTITDAVTQARLVPGANRIEVAAGAYPELVNLNNAADDGLTIEGAGAGSSVVTPPAGNVGFTLLRPGLTLRGMGINVPAANGQGIFLGGSSQTVDAVTVHMTGGDSDDIAVTVNSLPGTRTLSHLNVDDGGNASWLGDALFIASTPGPVTVTDSMLQSNQEVIETFAGSTVIQRVSALTTSTTLGRDVIAVVSPGPLVGGAKNAVLTLDSSLVFGGQEGVVANNAFSDAAPQSATAIIRNSTIDPLQPGRGSPAQDGQLAVHAFGGDGSMADASVTADSSILLAGLATGHVAGASSGITCTYSDLSNPQTFAGDATHGPITCGSDPGNAQHNSTTTPLTNLFVTPFIFNWHLRDGSAAIDTGSPAPLAAGESATDLDGNPRVLNGDGSCPAVRDKGAYEHAAVGSSCDPPATVPTVSGTPTAASTPKKKACKKKKRKRHAAAARKCKRKKRRG